MKRFHVRKTASGAAMLLLLSLSLPFVSGQQARATSVSLALLPPPPVVARLSASPAKYRGHCPATIAFNGEISAPPGVQAGPAGTFRFVRSDGHQSAVRTFKAGVSTPSTTWRVGGRSTHQLNGWVQIEILTPVQMTSPRAEFTVQCN